MPLPERIANAPVLEIGLEWVYLSFAKLSTDRQLGMGTGPIPWSCINGYAQRFGMDDDEQEDFEFLIEKMDDTFMKHAAKKQEQQKSLHERQPLKTKLAGRK